jgi:hypothetical protein
MNGKANKNLKNLICVGLVILALVIPAKATLVTSNSIIVDDIEYYTQTNKSVYDLGEDVEMLHRVTNLGVEDIMFQFITQAQCSFEVWDAETIIWWWPKYASQSGSSFTLQPGEFKEFLTDWDMMNDNGTPEIYDNFLVSPGIYYVSGQLKNPFRTIPDGVTPESVSVSIEIIPEPATILLFGLGVLLVKARKPHSPTPSCRRWK